MTASRADRCFFVLGYGRSGTTLFRRMLSAHPNLFVPPENDVFQRLPPLIRSRLQDRAALEHVIAAFPPYYGRIYDVERFRDEAAGLLPLTAPEFFVILFGTSRIAEGKSDPAWGHKAPSEWPYIGTWRTWFPSSKYLHIVRHPHDATASMVENQLQRYRTTPLIGIWQWRRAYRAIRRHGRELGPERYLMVHYEDLVSEPERTLADTCRFLGVTEDAVPLMVDFTSHPSAAHVEQGEHMARTNTMLTAERIGRGIGDYTARQAAMLDHVCRHELRALGYEVRATRPVSRIRMTELDATCVALDLAWTALRATRRARGQL